MSFTLRPCRHTHFGCDQVFSRHSIYLRTVDALTLPDLITAFEASWESPSMGRVKVFELGMAADVKGWLAGHVDERLHNLTTCHQYVFEQKFYEGKKRAVLTAKQFSISLKKDWVLVGPVLRVRTRLGLRL